MFVIDPTALSPDVVSAVAAIGGAIVVKLLEYAVNKKDVSKKPVPSKSLDELQIELDSCRAENIKLQFEKQSLESEVAQATEISDSDEHRIEHLTVEVKKLQKKIAKHIDDTNNGSK